MEKDNKYYDKVYEKSCKSGQYGEPAERTQYYPMWKEAINMVSDDEAIVDFGCGVGQVASVFLNAGKKYLIGYDFSEYAIEHAKNNLGGCYFKCVDIFFAQPPLYDVALCFEVLEHIDKDVEFIKSLPKGKRFIFSIPNFIVDSHVRCFKDEKEIYQRYGFLKIKSIKRFDIAKNKWIYLIDSVI